MMTAGIKRTWIGTACTIVTLTLGAVASAQTMADYQAQPEFIADAVPPNILMLMDNSGSMNSLAYGILNSGGTPVTPFDPNKDYNGIFDPLKCYQYSSSGDKFVPSSSTLGSVGATCTNASYPWHGNLLNYVTVRRLDVVKWVMVGGNCNSGTLGAGTCNQLKGQDQFVSTACCRDQTARVLASDLTGRIPAAQLSGLGTNAYFHQKGSDSSHRGFFCLDDDATMTTNNGCDGGDGGGYAETKWGIKADVSVSPVGVVQSIGKKARMGMMQFHDGSSGTDGGKLTAEVGAIPGPNGVQEDMVNAVSSMIATASTPLAESLYEATRYFAQAPPVYANSDFTDTVDTKDPYWFKSGGQGWANPAQLVKCCKSFVIIFTDGSPTNDTRVPPSMQDAAHGALGHGSGDQAGHHDVCSSYWGGPTNDSCVSTGGTHYLDDVAYYAHTKDLRPDTGDLVGLGAKSGSSIVDGNFTPPNESRYRLPGMQNLNIYTFLAFGSGQEILKATARAGGFEDANGNGIPDNGQTPAGACVANGPCEYDKYNNMSGVAGPDGVPDNYFFSNDADDLKDRLLATINSILQRSASGTAASVLANSSTGEGALYQAFFYPRTTEASKDVAWAGYVKGFFIDAFGNLREDSSGPNGTGAPDGRLVYDHDLIIKMEYDSSLNKVVVKRYADSSPADGKADSTTPIPGPTPDIRQVKGIWEAGDKLAGKAASARKLYTWVDKNNDGVVDANERIEFKKGGTEETDLTPYLYPGLVGGFTIGVPDLIDFIRGCEPSDCSAQANFRYRTLTSSAGQKVWKLGDPVHSTPTVVAAPRERYDVLYGDESYSKFFKDYRCRRNVIYVGANDGVLHAFNGGFYNRGDKSSTSEVEHGYFELDRASTCPGLPATIANTAALGDELWGFIPMQALPHLRWLADPKYSHVYYVDAKPKVTDVRIFCTSPAVVTPCINGQSSVTHTDGWGTILIGSFRFGGSCGNATCASGAGAVKKMGYTHAGFGTDTTREFLSAYFVLDITDPEQPPVLLWSFSETDLGFTTSYPAVARVKPSCSTLNCKTDPTDAQWLALFGSGPTNYSVDTIAQSAKMYAVDLRAGPGVFTGGANKYAAANVKKMVVESSGSSMMGDMGTVDLELDYRVNVSYAGSTIGTGAPWTGKLYRLSTPCPGAPCWDSWGITDGAGGRSPTLVVDNFVSSAGTLSVGPVSAGVTVTKDDANQVWVFFGTGRYWSIADRTLSEQEYFFGIKDSVHSGTCTEASLLGCREQNLVDVSAAQVCLNCANPVSGVSEGSATPATLLGSTTTSLQGLVATKRGWFTKLPLPGTSAVPAAPLERVLVTPTLAGGIVFFPSFVPKDDLCISLGNGYLYALFYQTGSAHTVPVLGATTNASGDKISNRNIFLGEGQISQLGVHIGAQGSGAVGGGCSGNMSVIGQTSTGAIVGSCTNTQGAWSKYISWKDQRD